MKVKKIRLALLFFVFALILVTGCNKEEEKDDPYSTVSNMIAERNKARFSRAAQDSSSKRAVGNEPVLSDEIPPAAQTERAKLPGITIEENIKIAQNFKPLTADQMLAIEAKTKPYYKELLFFKLLSEWPAEW